MNTLRFFFLFFFFTVLSSPQSFGKNLHQRLGVGYMKSTFEDLGTLVARYYPDPNWGVAGALGIDTKQKDGKFSFLAKFYYLVFKEENMNFYMGSGGGLISRSKLSDTDNEEVESKKSSVGFTLNAFIGGEFFLPGLENLGFSFESGIGVTSVENEVRFQTMGLSPIRAGMIFYF